MEISVNDSGRHFYLCQSRYHKPGTKCYTLNFNEQARYYSERPTVNCITICNSSLF